MFDISINRDDKNKLIESACEKVVDELLAETKKHINIKSIIESSKARLTNNLQKEVTNRIIEAVDIEQITKNITNEVERLAQDSIKKSINGGCFVFKTNMNTKL
jgi:dihydroneopterin aldolase